MANNANGASDSVVPAGNDSQSGGQLSTAFRSPAGNVTLNAANVGNNADDNQGADNQIIDQERIHNTSVHPSPTGAPPPPASSATPPLPAPANATNTTNTTNASIAFPAPKPGQMVIGQAFVWRNSEYISVPILYYTSHDGRSQYAYPFTRRTIGDVWHTPNDFARCELHPVANPTLEYLVDRADLPLPMVRRFIYGLEMNGGGAALQLDLLSDWRADIRAPNSNFTAGVPCFRCGRVNPVRLVDVLPLENIKKGLCCHHLGKDCINERQFWDNQEGSDWGDVTRPQLQQTKLAAPPGLVPLGPPQPQFGYQQMAYSQQQPLQYQQQMPYQQQQSVPLQQQMGYAPSLQASAPDNFHPYQGNGGTCNHSMGAPNQTAFLPTNQMAVAQIPPAYRDVGTMNVQQMQQAQQTPVGTTPSMWKQVENWGSGNGGNQMQMSEGNNLLTPGTAAHNSIVQAVLAQLGVVAQNNQPPQNAQGWNANAQVVGEQRPDRSVAQVAEGDSGMWNFESDTRNGDGYRNSGRGSYRNHGDRTNGDRWPRKDATEIELTDEIIQPGEPLHADLDQFKMFVKQEKGVSSHLPDPRALVRGKPLKVFEEFPPTIEERKEFAKMRHDRTLQWYVGVIAKKVANATITLLKCNTKDDISLYGSWENTITIFFNKEGIRNSCVRVYLAQETFSEEVSSWWGAHQNRRPHLSLSWAQFTELIKTELFPDIEDGTTDEKWADLRFDGDVEAYLKKVHQMSKYTAMPLKKLQVMAARPLGYGLTMQIKGACAAQGVAHLTTRDFEDIFRTYVINTEAAPGFRGWREASLNPISTKDKAFPTRNPKLRQAIVEDEEEDEGSNEEMIPEITADVPEGFEEEEWDAMVATLRSTVVSSPAASAQLRIGKGPRPCFVCGADNHSWIRCEKRKKGKCGVCGKDDHFTRFCSLRYYPNPTYLNNNGNKPQAGNAVPATGRVAVTQANTTSNVAGSTPMMCSIQAANTFPNSTAGVMMPAQASLCATNWNAVQQPAMATVQLPNGVIAQFPTYTGPLTMAAQPVGNATAPNPQQQAPLNTQQVIWANTAQGMATPQIAVNQVGETVPTAMASTMAVTPVVGIQMAAVPVVNNTPANAQSGVKVSTAVANSGVDSTGGAPTHATASPAPTPTGNSVTIPNEEVTEAEPTLGEDSFGDQMQFTWPQLRQIKVEGIPTFELPEWLQSKVQDNRPRKRVGRALVPLQNPDESGQLYFATSIDGSGGKILYDPGASHCFLDYNWARRNGLKIRPRPVTVRTIHARMPDVNSMNDGLTLKHGDVG